MDKTVNIFEQVIKSGGFVFVGVGILFILIAIVVGVFKQTWLISGVNTMPKEKLVKMDLKYMAKYFGLFFGIFGGIVTLSPFIFIYLNIMKYFFGFFMISTLGFCTFMILYFNVFKRKRIYNKKDTEQAQSTDVPTKIWRKFIHIAIAVAFVGLMLLSGEREYKIVIDTNTFKLKGVYGVNLPFAEIAEADTIARSKMPAISIRTNGYGGFKMRKGWYKTTGGDGVYLNDYRGASPVIRIVKHDGSVFYISRKNATETRQIFKKLNINN